MMSRTPCDTRPAESMFRLTLSRWIGPGWRSASLALLAGALLPLGFAPFDLFPLAFLCPALLFLLWREATPRAALGSGFCFGLGLFGVGVSWVYVAIHDFGYTAMPLAVILTALFVIVLALYPALLGYCAARLIPRLKGSEGLIFLLLLPALWTLFEWLRGWLFTGFPWLSLGYSQIDTPLRGLAPLLGVYGISWACTVTGGALVYLLLRKRRGLVLALPLLIVVWGSAWLLTKVEWTQPQGEPLSVSLVQGNLPQLTKWDVEKIQERLDLYAQLSLSRFGESDLVILPENALTVFYQELKDEYLAWLDERAKASGTDLVLGLPVLDSDGRHYFTSMMSLGGKQGFYHKRHLVPFGEFIPLEGLLRGLIAFFELPMSGFSPGPEQQSLLEVAGQRAAVTICYEDAFGSEVIRALPEATLLINGSNNAWYGDSLAPHQHLQISRMRTVETGRPLLRATTNGISALVDHRGRFIATSPQFKTHVLDGEVQPMSGATPYVRWGNYPLLLLLLAACIGVGLVINKKSKATS